MTNKHLPLNVSFPEARAIFEHKPKSFDDVKDNCLVSFDANVLLAPYGFGSKPFKDISAVYKSLVDGNRLVLTGQAVREFAKWRNSKIGEIIQTVDNLKSKLNNPMEKVFGFLHDYPEYQEALQLAKKIEDSGKELKDKLSKISDIAKSWSHQDPVWEFYRGAFRDSVIELSEDGVKSLSDDLAYRTAHSLPPGFRDSDKSDGGAGDLVIWKTVLEVGARDNRDLVFVTMDQKNDWWTQAGGAPLFPRLELVAEYYKASAGKTIFIMRFSEFLDKFNVENDTVEEIKDAEDQIKHSTINKLAGAVAELVSQKWSDDEKSREIEREIAELDRLLADKTFPLLRYAKEGQAEKLVREAGTMEAIRQRRTKLIRELRHLNSKSDEWNLRIGEPSWS